MRKLVSKLPQKFSDGLGTASCRLRELHIKTSVKNFGLSQGYRTFIFCDVKKQSVDSFPYVWDTWVESKVGGFSLY